MTEAEGMEREGRSPCPIVGVGASAGGLAAFEAFFQGVPAGTSPAMAFVLVQHLAADRRSRLTEIVAGFTHLEVRELRDGTIPERGRVYVLPPGREVVLRAGRLLLLEPVAPRGRRLPIDLFFRSLAGELADQGVGVVLSGTGQDGAQGIRTLHAAGALCLAQNPASAEHDDMPRSALATGCVEAPLPPAEMYAVIRDHLERVASSPRPAPSVPPKGDPTPRIPAYPVPALFRWECGPGGGIEWVDSGNGRSAESVRNRLFKPFDSTKPGGFGICAYDARELVRALNGGLEVESREGLGTCFVSRLPRADAAELCKSLGPGGKAGRKVA